MAAGLFRKKHKTLLVLEKGVWTVKQRTSLWLLKMYAAANVFRNFQKKKKQNIVSGVRCMDSETTDQPVAGQNVCGS